MSETRIIPAALSIAEAAAYLNVSRATLYRLLGSGAFRSCSIGRRRVVLRSELDRFLQERMEDD
jgi:excisionase family DNA binding protein